MALRFEDHEPERDYLLLPLPPKDFNYDPKNSGVVCLNCKLVAGGSVTLGVLTPESIQTRHFGFDVAGNTFSLVDDLGNALNKVVVDVWPGSKQTFAFGATCNTANVRGPLHLFHSSFHEEDLDPTAAMFATVFDQIRPITGPSAEPTTRNLLLESWSGTGEAGASWLVRKLQTETNIDAQEAALSALARVGRPAVGYVIAELLRLRGTRDADHITLFLRALRRFKREWLGEQMPLLHNLIETYGSSEYPEVREAAYRCTELLPQDQALEILRARRTVEQDLDNRDTIEELLEEVRRGR